MPANQTKTALIKQKFPEAYVRNGLNGSKAIRELKPHLTERSSVVEQNRLLSDANIKEAVLEEMDKQGVNNGSVVGEFKHILLQRHHYPAKVAILDQYWKLKGYYAPEKSLHATLNIPTNLDELNSEIASLEAELKQLRE